MWHIWETGEVLAVFCWGNLNEGDYSEDRAVDGKIVLKCIFRSRMGRHGKNWPASR
jgi:hypothetical protein